MILRCYNIVCAPIIGHISHKPPLPFHHQCDLVSAIRDATLDTRTSFHTDFIALHEAFQPRFVA